MVNFLELVGESMGLEREDQFKRLKTMQDVGAIMADIADIAVANRLKLDDVEDIVTSELLAEQPLELGRGR